MSFEKKSSAILSWTVGLIFVLLPFHALFTTWLGSGVNNLDLIRVWKEVVIIAILPLVIWLTFRSADVRKWVRGSWLPKLILGYIFLQIALGLWALAAGKVGTEALLFGLIVNLRFFTFFLICVVLVSYSPILSKYWARLTLLPAALVIAFGLTQRFILPYDFLKHFGYGPETIPAYQTVDNKLDYRRIQSTLRGANPLGAYLALIIPIISVYLRKSRSKLLLGLGASLVVLFFTYSRSAWIAVFVSLGLLAGWYTRRYVRPLWLIAAAAAGVLLFIGAVYLSRHSYNVQDTLFHTSSASASSQSSNEQRAEALIRGTNDVISEPLGRGPGTAGPASMRNEKHDPRISENYFLQIGQEAGWLGLSLFIAINLMLGLGLWQKRRELLPQVLLTSLIGLSLINLVSHTWTDDTLAYIWWGLAGIATAPHIVTKRKRASL